jgi:hypothetical protein
MRLGLFMASAGLMTILTASASATTVDFDAQAAGRNTSFDGILDSPLTIGIATFMGGELLNNEDGGIDHSGVYGTEGFGTAGGYTNTETISFSQGVSGFSLLLTNNVAGTFNVSDNLGDTETLVLDTNPQTFSLAGTGITSVSIVQEGSGDNFDFAIDNVSFTTATAPAVPEPSSFVLLGTGILGAFGAARRRFAA